jgi:PIN domain nuclease of toxin-antitoxin system
MDLGVDARGRPVRAAFVILLDTNALIWLEQGHRRVRQLAASRQPLYISPPSLLELQFLAEIGRIRLRSGAVRDFAHDERWLLDDPPAIAWFEEALEPGCTRDPFDRLIVAHARSRGSKLATADSALPAHLSERERLAI